MRIIGAIIAGGKSSRMAGKEKAFLQLAGKSILDLVIGRLDQQVDRVVINANGDARRFSETGLEVVPDVMTDLTTPLAGLHACLRHADQADFLVTVPSDTPFLPLDLVSRLVGQADGARAAIAHSAGQDHYLIGAWRVDLLQDIEMAIQKDGVFRVKDWVRRIAATSVPWPHLPYDPFLNVNTPDDLKLAANIVSTHS
jgi:molybdenum cofactor guanylyltransferase